MITPADREGILGVTVDGVPRSKEELQVWLDSPEGQALLRKRAEQRIVWDEYQKYKQEWLDSPAGQELLRWRAEIIR